MNGEGIVLEFLRLFLEDQERGGIRPLEEYLQRFPGFEVEIRREYRLVTASREGRDLGANARVGPYVLQRFLGAGGYGVVYVARDERLDRLVAVKVLNPTAELRPGALRRFRREAQIASHLDDRGLCQVHDVELDRDPPYIVMEYVDGETLAVVLARSRRSAERGDDRRRWVHLPPLEDTSGSADRSERRSDEGIERVLLFVEEIARSIHAAHTAGVVHRDLNPGNVMVTPRGSPVVLDFGLALEIDSTSGASTRGAGTPHYMAPEQLAGESLDRRVDVWALGVMLYECLTLVRPFDGVRGMELGEAIRRHEPTSSRRRNANVSRDLDVVLRTALEKDRERRYHSAFELSEELGRIRRFEPIRARAAGPLLRLRRWARRNPPLAFAIAIVFVSLVLGLISARMLLGEVRRESELKEDALREIAQLADVLTVERLTGTSSTLWPRRIADDSETRSKMRAWLSEARAMVAERLPVHEATLASVNRRLAAGDHAALQAQGRDLWLQGVVARLVRDVRALEPLIDSLLERLTLSEVLLAKSVVNAEAAWRECVEDLRSSPHFAGLALEPQVGLVPLGRNHSAGLWEFWYLGSGERPVWDVQHGAQAADGTGIVLVLLPGGDFWMGAQRTQTDELNFDPEATAFEVPAHLVELAPFFFSKFELTQEQWERVALGHANPSGIAHGGNWGGRMVTVRNPVESVSWDACLETAARFDLELPTEAQWEYAARSGDARTTTASDPSRTSNLADASALPVNPHWIVAHELDDGNPGHAPVGSYVANAFGLHDMLGNVEEWCRDLYGEYSSPARTGDGLRTIPTSDLRVYRGGSFGSLPQNARVSSRDAAKAESTSRFRGVRFARALR